MITQVTSAPTYLPVALSTLKEHLKLDASDTSEDVLLDAYLRASTSMAEDYVRGYFMPHTVEVYLEEWSYETLFYGLAPMQALDKVEYHQGTWQELGSEHYKVALQGPVPRLRIVGDMPGLDEAIYPIRITVQLGYSLSSDSEATQRAALDQRIVSAILLQAARLYETREDVNTKAPSVNDMIPASERLLSGLRNSYA